MSDKDAILAEQRHNRRLPQTLRDEGFGNENPPYAQFDRALLDLLQSDIRYFGGIQGKKVVTPSGVPATCMVLDVFDGPVYLLVDDGCTQVQLQAPVLKGLKVSEQEAVWPFLETYVSDLTFEMAPQRTLGAYQTVAFYEFVEDAESVLCGFCNWVREAAAYVRDHRAGILRDPLPPELVA